MIQNFDSEDEMEDFFEESMEAMITLRNLEDDVEAAYEEYTNAKTILAEFKEENEALLGDM